MRVQPTDCSRCPTGPQLAHGHSTAQQAHSVNQATASLTPLPPVATLPSHHQDVTEDDLAELFGPFGPIQRIFVAKDRETGACAVARWCWGGRGGRTLCPPAMPTAHAFCSCAGVPACAPHPNLNKQKMHYLPPSPLWPGESRGFAFINFIHREDANRAIAKLDGATCRCCRCCRRHFAAAAGGAAAGGAASPAVAAACAGFVPQREAQVGATGAALLQPVCSACSLVVRSASINTPRCPDCMPFPLQVSVTTTSFCPSPWLRRAPNGRKQPRCMPSCGGSKPALLCDGRAACPACRCYACDCVPACASRSCHMSSLVSE